MKRLFFVLVSFAFGAPAAAGDYLMIGLYDIPKAGAAPVCWDVGIKTIPLKSHLDYRDASSAFMKAYRGKSPTTKLLAPGTVGVVFKYRVYSRGFRCEREAHVVYKDRNVAGAKAQMERYRKENAKEFRSEPEVVLTWPGR